MNRRDIEILRERCKWARMPGAPLRYTLPLSEPHHLLVKDAPETILALIAHVERLEAYSAKLEAVAKAAGAVDDEWCGDLDANPDGIKLALGRLEDALAALDEEEKP